MRKADYPTIERSVDIEIPHCRNGRPGYKWVQGWIIRYSESRVTTPMRYREARNLMEQERNKS